jgi:hypothetical protein
MTASSEVSIAFLNVEFAWAKLIWHNVSRQEPPPDEQNGTPRSTSKLRVDVKIQFGAMVSPVSQIIAGTQFSGEAIVSRTSGEIEFFMLRTENKPNSAPDCCVLGGAVPHSSVSILTKSVLNGCMVWSGHEGIYGTGGNDLNKDRNSFHKL